MDEIRRSLFGGTFIGILSNTEFKKKIYHHGFGGDTSNTAISVARQGMVAGFVCKIGKDNFGKALIDLWKRENVDYSHVTIHPEAPTGIYFISHDSDGHHFNYYRSNSAASKITPSDLPYKYLAGTKILHLSAITQAISKSSCETATAAIVQAKRNGVKVAYDTNLRLKLWSIEHARDVINSTVPKCDVILPSFEDANTLTGLMTPDEIINYYLDIGAKLIVLKLGRLGVLITDGNDNISIPGHNVNAIDATGAGDIFDGVFLSEWLRRGDPFVAAEFANAAAALSTKSFGAVDSIPSHDEVIKFLG